VGKGVNKAELVEVIHRSFATIPGQAPGARQRREVKIRDVDQMISAMIGAISGTLKKGGTVTIEHFGTFHPVVWQSRSGRNPRTGAAIKIKSRKRATFTPSRTLQTLLN
jgi:DNA-binding protein HU-beta